MAADAPAWDALLARAGLPRLDARAPGRGVVHRRNDLHQPALGRDGQADARIGPGGSLLKVVETGRWQIVGMGIQRRHHARQRRLDQLLVVDRHHIVLLDDRQHVAEQLQHPERLVARRLGRDGHSPEAKGDDGGSDDQAFLHQMSFEDGSRRLGITGL
jgi:hypothetical protein